MMKHKFCKLRRILGGVYIAGSGGTHELRWASAVEPIQQTLRPCFKNGVALRCPEPGSGAARRKLSTKAWTLLETCFPGRVYMNPLCNN